MGLQELEGFESPFVDDFAGAVSPFRLLSQAAGSRPAIASTAGLTARIVFRVRHGDLPYPEVESHVSSAQPGAAGISAASGRRQNAWPAGLEVWRATRRQGARRDNPSSRTCSNAHTRSGIQLLILDIVGFLSDRVRSRDCELPALDQRDF
jgi:hypothetical protein